MNRSIRLRSMRYIAWISYFRGARSRDGALRMPVRLQQMQTPKDHIRHRLSILLSISTMSRMESSRDSSTNGRIEHTRRKKDVELNRPGPSVVRIPRKPDRKLELGTAVIRFAIFAWVLYLETYQCRPYSHASNHGHVGRIAFCFTSDLTSREEVCILRRSLSKAAFWKTTTLHCYPV